MPFSRLLASVSPVVLVYHGTARNGQRFSAQDFEAQLDFLVENFELIGPGRLNDRRRRTDRIQVMLTFDDGLRNNAEIAAPMLSARGIPAIFFVCTRPAGHRGWLWFSYLEMLARYFDKDALEFRGELFDMKAPHRSDSVALLRRRLLSLRPHPTAMYDAIEQELPPLEVFTTAEQRRDECDGMSAEQIAALAANQLFTIGAHTVDHPLLTKCTPADATYQVCENKKWLESVIGKRCSNIAYPISDYDTDILRITSAAGFECGFSAETKIPGDKHMQVPRVGIYYPSLIELGFKVRWGNALQAVQRTSIFRHDWGAVRQSLQAIRHRNELPS